MRPPSLHIDLHPALRLAAPEPRSAWRPAPSPEPEASFQRPTLGKRGFDAALATLFGRENIPELLRVLGE